MQLVPEGQWGTRKMAALNTTKGGRFRALFVHGIPSATEKSMRGTEIVFFTLVCRSYYIATLPYFCKIVVFRQSQFLDRIHRLINGPEVPYDVTRIAQRLKGTYHIGGNKT